jgi:dethiobiotin synthetase
MAMDVFITGIDTDAGKSIVTGLLAKELYKMGVDVITSKLVQTGCSGMADDIISHRRLMGIDLLPDDMDGRTCAYQFSFPASPHLSARLEGVEVDPKVLHNGLDYLEAKYQLVLTEGAGGLMVPLTDRLLAIDFVMERQMPIVLVTSGRLGSINHTLLSIEACLARGLNILGVVFNRFPGTSPVIADESSAFLQRYLAQKCPSATWDEVPIIENFDGLGNAGCCPNLIMAICNMIKH